MKKEPKLSQKDLLEAISRSGYLLESEVAKILVTQGFFVESSQVVRDPLTLKSREIDLIAEYQHPYEEFQGLKMATKVRFVFEIKNNIYPVVVLSEMEDSPNTQPDLFLKTVQTGLPANHHHDINADFWSHFYFHAPIPTTFTQYCSFQRKKVGDTLMAFHPEELYSGLQKVSQYCEEELLFWEEGPAHIDQSTYNRDDYYRNFLYLPVILLKEDLYEVRLNVDRQPSIDMVPYVRYLFNYFFRDEPKSSLVYFVTQDALLTFVSNVLGIEQKVRKSMLQLRKSQLGEGSNKKEDAV